MPLRTSISPMIASLCPAGIDPRADTLHPLSPGQNLFVSYDSGKALRGRALGLRPR
jgi:hypothetical protein